jgi:GLE1-like protein
VSLTVCFTFCLCYRRSQRGDGFPLANMLALVAVQAKDFVPVLAAHIFTVCPTAVPTLPHPAPDATEDNLMESLGMLRGKDGQFESFERFLSRTEVRCV